MPTGRPKIFLKALPDKVQCHKVCLTIDLDQNTQLRVEMHLAESQESIFKPERTSLKAHAHCKMMQHMCVCVRDGIKSNLCSFPMFQLPICAYLRSWVCFGRFWLPALQTKACQSHIGSDDTFHWQVACLLVLGAEGYNISGQRE